MAMSTTLTVAVVSQEYADVQIYQLYTLNMCRFLYINYISIKLFLKKQNN